MAILAWVLGVLGILCGAMGGVTAFGVAPTLIEGTATIGPILSTTIFWWGTAIILLLSAIAAALGRERED